MPFSVSTLAPHPAQQVPPSKDEREKIRTQVNNAAENALDRNAALSLTKSKLEELARTLAADESYLAWIMVLLGSRLWLRQVKNVPFNRRILLLPHCMHNALHCPAKYDAVGLHCIGCGQCELGALKSDAEQLGYTVLIAEGSPAVMQLILNRNADAVLGVGCLRSLERAFEKLQIAGIPALAVPLHQSLCKDSQTDLDWVREMIHTPYIEPECAEPASPYLPLLREAVRLFDDIPDHSTDIFPDIFKATRQRAEQFLRSGGKFYRPFITLATFDALTNSLEPAPIPQYVKTAAQAVEIFHKASLVHDDIEDGDPFRYGQPTLHEQYGAATAVNIGDYLLGLGYRNIAALRQDIAPDIAAEMLGRLSEAHLRLSGGQGAELAWRERTDRMLTPEEVLKVYVLKTAPAFEAAMGLGVLSSLAAGGTDWTFYRQTQEPLGRFARHLGVAFQIKNDIDDWFPDGGNKQVVGGDAVKQRPTLLRALAESQGVAAELKSKSATVSVQEVYERFEKLGVFEQAQQLIVKFAQKAQGIAEAMSPLPFRELLRHFVETIAQ